MLLESVGLPGAASTGHGPAAIAVIVAGRTLHPDGEFSSVWGN